MDLVTVRDIRPARTRADVFFDAGERPLGGGTWLFSEEQAGLTGLVDLTTLDWQPTSETDAGLTISATCTLAELAAIEPRAGWVAHPLFRQCVTSLLGSFKVWNVATVGGNICLALPAGPMTSLAASLDATALVWTADGGERRMPVAEFVAGVRSTTLLPGEVLRAIEIPREALESRTGFRRISLSPLGRTGTLVVARESAEGEVTVTVTGGTARPVVLRFDELPTSSALERAVLDIDCWYDDAHGAPDWRRGVSALFAEQLRVELGGAA